MACQRHLMSFPVMPMQASASCICIMHLHHASASYINTMHRYDLEADASCIASIIHLHDASALCIYVMHTNHASVFTFMQMHQGLHRQKRVYQMVCIVR